MNRKHFLLISALLMAAMSADAQDTIRQMYAGTPITVYKPVMNDSVNANGETFAAKDLLDTYIPLRMDKSSCSQIEADETGYFNILTDASHSAMCMTGTSVRSDRFMKGKLCITSPCMYEVFVNGKSVLTKDTAEDSLSTAADKEVPLTMEPERNYDIRIKLLTEAGAKAPAAMKCEIRKDKGYEEASLSIAPDLKKRFMLENTTYYNGVRDVSLSPDGKYLLTLTTYAYSKDNTRYEYKLRNAKTGEILANELRMGLSWMPKSSKLYFTVKSGNGFDIMTLDPATMKEETLLRGVPSNEFTWSPTEDYLIFYPSDNGTEEAGPLRRILTPDDRIPGYRKRSFLSKYDIKSGTTQRITFGRRSTYLCSFSPDGRKILYNTYTENTTGRPLTLMSVYEVDMQDFSTDTIFTEEPFINDVNYSPDGRQLLIMGTPSAFDGIGLNCGEHKIANDYDIQAFIMDMDSKDIRPISKDFAPSLNFLQWNKADGCIYFNTDDENCRNIYKYDPKKDSFEKLPLEKDVITRFDIADFNPAVAAYTGMDNSSAGAAYLYNAKSKKSEIIEDPMRETIDAIEWGTTEEWNFTASDGTVIKGEMCLPPSFDPAKKYPLIVYYYGGTTPTVKGITSPYCSQLFASRDYVVYTIQPSGAIGFGQEFSARHVNAWGKRTADDIIEGTKQFCEEHPFIDKERIGCIGASYGGFMTQYLQTQTDIFAAAVSHAGISNVTSYWGEGYWGYSYNSIAAADSYPWTDPNLFTKQGSLFNADKINTPLLLLHGTADTNVPIGESIQLFNALKILGKTVELITVDGEDHFISDYDKRCLWHNTIMAWFARWLQDSPQWWESIYPEKEI